MNGNGGQLEGLLVRNGQGRYICAGKALKYSWIPMDFTSHQRARLHLVK